jgi:2-oxoglutarate ferredoxin oxidoreductase subunit beta
MNEKNLKTYAKFTWCPGCGNFSILSAFQSAIKELSDSNEIKPENVVLAAGIGCHAKILDYINLNNFYSLHGRVPPPLTGVKIANPNLIPVGFAGDGDAYSEGISHLIHSAKKNSDIKMIIHDNQVFALTTGQFTPTTPHGLKTKTSPEGLWEYPINPLGLMLAAGATFVARGFSGNPQHLKKLMKEAIRHKGFAIIDVLEPCLAFNKVFQYFKERVYDLNETDHDIKDFHAAFAKTYEMEKIPIGIFYKTERETLEEQILKGKVLAQDKKIASISHII